MWLLNFRNKFCYAEKDSCWEIEAFSHNLNSFSFYFMILSWTASYLGIVYSLLRNLLLFVPVQMHMPADGYESTVCLCNKRQYCLMLGVLIFNFLFEFNILILRRFQNSQ